jgi:Holliday junction resolvasome RuvABC endonuclease subunit
MALSSLVSSIKNVRVIAVDPASHSLAWAVLDFCDGDISVVDHGKIMLSKSPELSNKFATIKKELPIICEKYNPSVGVIEQSVFIQNFQSSRILSYIIGFTWGVLDDDCNIVMDVNPLTWKAGIGYKNLTKKEVHDIELEHGKKGMQKRLSFERKNRVRVILESKLPGFVCDGLDSDITDAIGIGLWYGVSHGLRTL